MRKILLLAIFVGVLVGTGVLSVKWNNGTAVIHYDKDKAKEETGKLVKEVKVIEAEVEKDLDSNTNTTELPQPPQR